jgi:diaminopimelate epimerase
MRIFNADGGEAELSGNGLRCLAAHLFYYRIHCADELEIQTLAGLKGVRLARSSPPEYFFEVQMGEPILDPRRIPFHPMTEPLSLVGCELAVGEEVYSVTITSMGNPHCSIFCDDFASKDWEYLGGRIETHPSFPKRTNVEFIKVKSRRKIQVRFWERGVGKTKASGTGSCAAVVASVLNGYTDRGVEVQTLGGYLKVHWQPDNSLILQGPARIICDGDYKGSS